MKKLKKRITIIMGLLLLTISSGFFGFWSYAAAKAKPLYGDFDIGMRCMGGHEIFLDLASDGAYDNCPGHRSRERIGRIVRESDSVTVIDPRDDSPWFRIDWNGSFHSLTFLKRPDSQSLMGMIPVRGEIRQVANPWRLWLPRILPQE